MHVRVQEVLYCTALSYHSAARMRVSGPPPHRQIVKARLLSNREDAEDAEEGGRRRKDLVVSFPFTSVDFHSLFVVEQSNFENFENRSRGGAMTRILTHCAFCRSVEKRRVSDRLFEKMIDMHNGCVREDC